MNILYLSHERKMGGANRSLYELALAMKKRGHNVSVAVLFSGCPIDVELRKQGINTVPCFYGWWMEPANWPVYMKWAFRLLHSLQWLAVKRLSRYVMENYIDIIHSNSSTIDIGIYIKKNVAKLGKQVKHIWHIREYGDIDYQLEFMKGRDAAIQDINNGSDKIICISKALREYYHDIENVDVIYDGLTYTDSARVENKHPIQVDDFKKISKSIGLDTIPGENIEASVVEKPCEIAMYKESGNQDSHNSIKVW